MTDLAKLLKHGVLVTLEGLAGDERNEAMFVALTFLEIEKVDLTTLQTLSQVIHTEAIGKGARANKIRSQHVDAITAFWKRIDELRHGGRMTSAENLKAKAISLGFISNTQELVAQLIKHQRDFLKQL